MVKIQNLSSGSIILKFQNAAGIYTKNLRANAVIKLTSKEHKELLPIDSNLTGLLKVTRYNIHASNAAKIEIYNPTKDKSILTFQKSETDKYDKILPSNGSILLSEDEFSLIKKLDSRLEIMHLGASKKSFISAVESIIRPNPKEEIPVVESILEVVEEVKAEKKIFKGKKERE